MKLLISSLVLGFHHFVKKRCIHPESLLVLYIDKLRPNSRHPTVYPTSNLTFTLTTRYELASSSSTAKMEKHFYIFPSNWGKISTFFSQNRENFYIFLPKWGKISKLSPCAAKAFYSCPAIISHRPESQKTPKEPQ